MDYRILVPLCLALFWCGSTTVDGFAAEIPWSTNLEASLQQGRVNGKNVLLEFTASWCVYCIRMEKTTFHDADVVRRVSEQFVAVRVDADQHKDLVSQLGIHGLPAILIVSPDLQIIERISGFQTPSALIARLNKIHPAAAMPTGTGSPAAPPSVSAALPAAAASVTPQPGMQFEPLERDVPDLLSGDSTFHSVSESRAAPAASQQRPETTLPDGNAVSENVTDQSRQPRVQNTWRSADNKPAFKGACLVSAVEERVIVPGSLRHQLNYRGKLIYFSTEECKHKFQADPLKYWPMLDGICAASLIYDTQRVEGSLEYAALFRNRVWLFTSEETMSEFLSNPVEIVEEAAEIQDTLF